MSKEFSDLTPPPEPVSAADFYRSQEHVINTAFDDVESTADVAANYAGSGRYPGQHRALTAKLKEQGVGDADLLSLEQAKALLSTAGRTAISDAFNRDPRPDFVRSRELFQTMRQQQQAEEN